MNEAKTLVIVESPSKAKKIQEYLGPNYVVRASYGHIVDLASGGKHGLGVDIDNNFRPHYTIMSDKMVLLQELMDLASTAKEVILSTDNDREGLSIARHLYTRLQDYNKTFKRIVFTEITKKAILKAMENYEDINSIDNLNMFHSQEARRILDRLVGFMASPFLMNFFGSNLSAGRVQSVLTRMIVDREREIETFKPDEYWTILARLNNPDNAGSSKWSDNCFTAKYEPRITNQTAAEIVKSELDNQIYVVSKVEAKEEKKKPAPPLITAKLQQLMSKDYGISSDRTMKAAQSLYENGYVTYIRTDSVRISDEAQKEARRYLKENGLNVPKSANVFQNKDAAQDAHECIRPTELSIEPDVSGLADDEKVVYEAIWRYFLASQMQPAVYNTLKVSLHVKDNSKHTLKASGKALKSAGYLQMLNVSDKSSIDIPNLTKGQELTLWGKDPIKLEQKFTQPPARYSESHLLETLEKKNIGRPSTYSELLNKVTTRNYVEKDGNIFHPTELGKKITDELVQFFSFMEYDYTADIERQLDQIANGTINYLAMLKSFFDPFKTQLGKAYTAHGFSEVCPTCKSPMVMRSGKDQSKFFGCIMYPGCFGTKAA